METPKGKYDTELLKYQQTWMANSEEEYYTELYNTITDFNDHNHVKLSSVKI